MIPLHMKFSNSQNKIALFEAIFIQSKIKKSKGIVKIFRMLVNSDTKQNKRIGWRGAHSQEC